MIDELVLNTKMVMQNQLYRVKMFLITTKGDTKKLQRTGD